jgi:molybdopterin biosynthesis enzyme
MKYGRVYCRLLLKPIRSEISFGGKTIKLDRSGIVGRLKSMASSSPVVILSGGAGVGKTAVIKDLYEIAKGSVPFFVFKATQFGE